MKKKELIAKIQHLNDDSCCDMDTSIIKVSEEVVVDRGEEIVEKRQGMGMG